MECSSPSENVRQLHLIAGALEMLAKKVPFFARSKRPPKNFQNRSQVTLLYSQEELQDIQHSSQECASSGF
jgi:hypothetical protein